MSAAVKSQPIAICDGGSNAVRMVIYRGPERVPEVLVQEKTFCQLGKSITTTGALDPEGRKLAIAALKKYVQAARRLKAGSIEMLCTEAVRKAKDGKDFLAEVKAATGLSPQIISGAKEARLAAYGILMGQPKADGVAGDLGGGSLELIHFNAGRVGENISLPLGTLRQPNAAQVKKELGQAPWLDSLKGRTFIAVGGSWRTLAKLFIRESKYPIDIVDGLTIDAASFAAYCEQLLALSDKEWKQRAKWLDKQVDDLPAAASLLAHILKKYRPAEVTFAAGGVREGALYARLPAAVRRQDPLIALTRRMAGRNADDLSLSGDRLMIAALLLSRIKWPSDLNPVMATLMLPVPGLPHGERAFLALVMANMFGLKKLPKELKACLPWLEEEDIETAEALGFALAQAE